MDIKSQDHAVMQVLLADPHTLFREGLEMILRDSKAVGIVGSVGDQKACSHILDTQPVDMLVIDEDILLARRGKWLRTRLPHHPQLGILVLGMSSLNQEMLDALELDGAIYMAKNRAPRKLVSWVIGQVR